jgi:hypothetical protein
MQIKAIVLLMEAPVKNKSIVPTREDWVSLRQAVKQKTGYNEDEAVQDYIMDKLGTQNLQLVSGQEVRQLITLLKAA